MRIVKYIPEYQKHFEQLNKAWLEKYFEIESMDEALFSNPDDAILKNGGRIFFAAYQNQIIGTVALIFISNGVYELAKMAVDEAFRGMDAGKLLCHTAVEEAKKLTADKLILFTNSQLKTAIGIYRKSGFKEVQWDGQEYHRADIKMELLLNPQTTAKWFDRPFDFNFGVGQFDNLLGRLEHFPVTLKQTLDTIPEQLQTFNIEGKWSVNQKIGHLFLLEIIGRGRFQEIKDGKAQMSPADLNNTATNWSSFNKLPVEELFKCFWYERAKTIAFLKEMSRDDLLKYSVHPGLNQLMRIIDLMYFAAEHGQHHLNAILKITDEYRKKNTTAPKL